MAKSKGSQLVLITQMESAISLLNLRAICERGRAEDKAFKFEALVFGSDDFPVSIGGSSPLLVLVCMSKKDIHLPTPYPSTNSRLDSFFPLQWAL